MATFSKLVEVSAVSLVCLGLSGCYSASTGRHAGSVTNRTSDNYTIVTTTTLGTLEGRATLAMPIPIRGHDTVLVPFTIEESHRRRDRDPYASGGYAYDIHRSTPHQSISGSGGPVRWHNAIVRDRTSQDEWLILNQRGVIGWWMAFGDASRDARVTARTDGLLFLATVEDSNGDGKLDDRDATVAIVTDADGRNPRVITPPGTQVWNVTYDHPGRRLFMYVVEDSSGNGRFGPEDLAVPYTYPLGQAMAEPIVSHAAIEQARQFLSAPVQR